MTCQYITNNPSDKWCEKFPIVHSDEDGSAYCVFHAPHGKKGLTLHEFNETVFKLIGDAQKDKKPCYIGGAIFEGDIDFYRFKKDNPLPSLNLSNVVFPGEVSFSNAHCKDSLMFIKTTFQGEASFNNTVIQGVCLFGAVTFQKRVDFFSAEFLGPTDFMGVRFSSMANFLSTNFNGWDVAFRDCIFEDYARFEISKFTGQTEIQQSFFKQNSNFEGCKFNGEVLLGESKFNKTANFKNVTFNGKASIHNTIFEEKADFANAIFSQNSFIKGETFHDIGIMTNLSMHGKLILDGVTLKKTAFLDSDLRKIDFYNCEWHTQNGWKLLYDEVSAITTEVLLTKRQLMGKIEILYRQLKQKCKEDNNEIDASNWHYREKELQRKGDSSLFIKIFLNIYYAASGYGENPRLALLVLLALILFSTFVLSICGLIPVNSASQLCNIAAVQWPENADIRQMIYLLNDVFKYVTLQKDACLQPTSTIGYLVKTVAQILIPIQGALFAFALKNKFRR